MSSFTSILHIARGSMLANLSHLDLVSNNLANVNTMGYKRSRANFQEMLNEQVLSGVQLKATQMITDQGALRQTDNPLDLAIDGEGFFGVTLPDGRIAYTRDGEFFLDAERQIVTAAGFPLVWDGEVPADAEEIHINPDGTVMTRQGDTWSQVGTIPLHRFANPSGLTIFGQNMWLANESSGAAQAGAARQGGYGAIHGNALEGSNVNLAEEMTQMVVLQRSFEMSVRTFQQTDQMLSLALQMRRG